ncbi:MAG: signal recognition particle-docking protein FtsY, partial [Candidatus Aenigmarchaeota archaeon]|nr:signal recognition particle-docking protein FtsY [Candidatus Aenigmarchaeota archaeon]
PKEEKKGFIKAIKEKTLSDSDVNEILDELQSVLLESDVALEAAERITGDVKKELIGKSVKRGEIESAIKTALNHALLDILSAEKIELERRIEEKEGPLLIVFVGHNGTGKTTTIAKLAHRLKRYNPVLAAGDTFRAASIEQLEEHGSRLGVRVVKHNYGADSAAVIFDAMKHAAATGSKVVLADTAGRSHSNVNLMDELKKVIRVNKPDMTILVLDSLTGNDIYDQARLFDEAVGIDGIILTKADVYDKGGAAISAAFTIKKPVLFLGVGQNYEDLKEFDAEEIVKNVMG